VFLPLLRYVLEDPEGFGGRMFSRLGIAGSAVEGDPFRIFLDNQWQALKMFSVSGGSVWPVSIPGAPALNVVAGALFYVGVTLVLVRAVRRKWWVDWLLLFAIPLLMLPSVLSLAFPGENPNLYRTGGAAVPVFVIAALGLDAMVGAMDRIFGPRRVWTIRLGLMAVLTLSAMLDFRLTFHEYSRQYQLAAWNTSEAGRVLRGFAEACGTTETAYLVGYPHWMDSRLVSLNAGDPLRDCAIFTDQLAGTVADPRPKLFLVHIQDEAALAALRSLYPSGWVRRLRSRVESKDFWIYQVPPLPVRP
jgi:hypothetical protein